MMPRMLVHAPRLSALALLALCAAPARTQEPVDEKAVQILRAHGLEHSKVMELLSWICDVHGPRLTGSPNLRRAQQWAVDTFAEFGVTMAKLEPWGPFGRGWQLDHFSMTVVGDNPWPVLAWPKAWSPSLPGRVVADVVLVGDVSADELRAMDLKGKFVLLEPPREVGEPFTGAARRWTDEDLAALGGGRQPAQPRERERRAAATPPAQDIRAGFQRRNAMLRLLWEKEPLAIADRGPKGDYGTVFVQGAAAPPPPADGQAAAGAPPGRGRPYALDAAPVIPQFTIAVEHYNRMCRMLRLGVPVKVAIELKTTFTTGDGMERNVIAEIVGTDPLLKDEVVMLGAHFDSWHSGTGATDNGCGSAVVMEAVRLLTVLCKELGHGPRRTIRAALWSGEEQGLLGSRAYVAEHFAVATRGGRPEGLKAEHAKVSGYFNLDSGTGRIRGVYLQGNGAVEPIFRAWLQPFHDLGATTLTINNTGGTDHLAFDAVGIPGFQFIQDPVAYDTRTHHSNMDNWDHAVAEDLRQAATIMASFVWHCAQRDEKLPRKPLPEPEPAEGEGRR